MIPQCVLLERRRQQFRAFTKTIRGREKKKNRSESASEKERERRKFGKQDKKRRKSKIDVFKARKILREYLYNLTGNDGMTSKTNSLLQS